MIEILDQYQELAARSAGETQGDHALITMTLGLAGEAGEHAEIIKKWWSHGHTLDEAAQRKELGDILWYLAGVATNRGWKLSDIATANIDKLKKRYPEGFSTARSLLRCICGHHQDDHSQTDYTAPCTQCSCLNHNQAHQLGTDGTETPIHTPR